MKKVLSYVLLICCLIALLPVMIRENVIKSDADEIVTSDTVTVDVPLPSIWLDNSGYNLVPAFYVKLVITSLSGDVSLVLNFYRKDNDSLIISFNLKSETSTTAVNVMFPFVKQSDSSSLFTGLSLLTTNSASSMVGISYFEAYKTSFPYMAGSVSFALPCYEILFKGYHSSGGDTSVIFRMYGMATVYPAGIDNYILYHGDVVMTDGISVVDISDAYQTAYQVGFSAGKAEGLSQGYSQGQTVGYQQGLEDGSNIGDLSFRSLITSVVDVPVKAFKGLFNFEILGVNLYSFFTALLTLALFIALFRIVWR